MNVLELKNVSKTYHTRSISTTALNNVNFSVKESEFIGIMGASGSGKTTLLNVSSGIDRCDSGNIHIMDQDISLMKNKDLSRFRRDNIGVIFQDFNLLNSLTVAENIMVPLLLDNDVIDADDDRIVSNAKMLGIEEILEKYPYELSGGQKQRAAICRALVKTPKIIFADEPTGNLDSRSSANVMTYLAEIHKNFGVSILLVTHDSKCASYCDKVIYISDGEIVNEISHNSDNHDFYNEIINLSLHEKEQAN